MKTYSCHGINDFVVCCGYKGAVIKEWFANYYRNLSDLTIDLRKNEVTYHNGRAEPWRLTLVDTGDATMTGGRLRRVRDFIGDDTFCLTYGDGVADVDISTSISFHRQHGCEATMTVVRPPGRFGAVALDAGQTAVEAFSEKTDGDGAWINGGYFVLEPRAIDRIDGDATIWEQAPLRSLANDHQLQAFKHLGFWQPMDTLHDRQLLESLWAEGRAPWKVW
jgi:glucose-1-phosphate cytidylyltransferase